MTRLLRALGAVAVVAVLAFTVPAGFAGKEVPLKAALTLDCVNCATDVANPNGPYSVVADGYGIYTGGGVSSKVNTGGVYVLDTESTNLGTPVRNVLLHFYDSSGRSVIPPCWGGAVNESVQVNWQLHPDIAILSIPVGGSSGGFARMNFNIRTAACDSQIARYVLRWYSICVTHPDANTWIARSEECNWLSNGGIDYGTAGLSGYGGQKSQTVYYGDFRMPFKLTLTK
jgi:hypothetical protein